MRRVDAALEEAVVHGRVPMHELDEINRLRDEYQTRLGDQRDPYREFQEAQSRLLAVALNQHGTPEGLKAYADFRHNEANPAPVGGGELA